MTYKDFWAKATLEQIAEKGCVLHQTNSPKVRGFVDSCNYISSEIFTINGWIASEDYGKIEDIRIKNTEAINIIFNSVRPDVAKYYKSDKVLDVGFSIDFTAATYTDKVIIQVLLKNSKTWINVFIKNLLEDRIPISTSVSKVNDHMPSIVVVDDFYTYPEDIREIALTLDYSPSNWHKGKRTKSKLILDGTKEKLEKILGKEIIGWTEKHGYCGVFQYCTPADPLVFHYDHQSHAAVVFLTPNAPVTSGTAFFRHKTQPWLTRALEVGKDDVASEEQRIALEKKYIGSEHNDFLDSTKWEEIDRIGNKFNRLAIWDARLIHAASQYFGQNVYDSRLFHMFFFDVKE